MLTKEIEFSQLATFATLSDFLPFSSVWNVLLKTLLSKRKKGMAERQRREMKRERKRMIVKKKRD